ncbi:hypothetical protein EOD39_7965 [Acipenser ruthenus]|uniref:Uncharacterized protein n=1 Tax=Acipenser ruthenus TaxID=7906 RepID=A0A444U5D8_ACIRT|nr:hypothetical protein EOD39_7965 [Acipenser ruthenus]
MLKECLQFFIEPAKNLKTVLKGTLRKASQRVKRDDQVLEECQLFIMELARELNRACEERLQQKHGWPENVGRAMEKQREGDERGVEDGNSSTALAFYKAKIPEKW